MQPDLTNQVFEGFMVPEEPKSQKLLSDESKVFLTAIVTALVTYTYKTLITD